MKKIIHKVDMSEEALITKFQGGIKLITPDQSSYLHHQYHLADLMRLPFAIYFLDVNGRGAGCNEEALIHCGIDSKKDALSKSIAEFASHESATRALINTEAV